MTETEEALEYIADAIYTGFKIDSGLNVVNGLIGIADALNRIADIMERKR